MSGTGRYVRMYGTARATAYGYSLFEFEVYGSSTAPTSTNCCTWSGGSACSLFERNRRVRRLSSFT